jgi:hypothetical protein
MRSAKMSPSPAISTTSVTHLISGDRPQGGQAGRSFGGAITGRGVDCSIGEDVDAPSDLDNL